MAFFCPTVSGTGGVESATRNLMAGFQALGDQVHLFLFGGSFDTAWLAGIDHTIISGPRDARPLRMAKYALGVRRAIWQWRPDAIICSDATTVQMARMGSRLARSRAPVASWIHYPLAEVRLKEKLSSADLHLAISAQIAKDLTAFIPGAPVSTIFNAVDIEAAGLVPRAATARFLYVGRLTFGDQKRVDDLLHAAANLTGEWKLTIIGGTPKGEEYHAERLDALASSLSFGGEVEWLGWQRDAWTAAGPSTALVMPSDREGFPMVLIEAIAHGMVCISSDCISGPAEIIEEGRNGWLFPVGDIGKLTALMQRLVDAPQALPSQVEVRATAERFSLQATAQRAKDAITDVILQRR